MAVIKIQTGLRLDEMTYSKLKFLATTDNRSINNFVEYIIKKYLTEYESEHGVIPLHPEE